MALRINFWYFSHLLSVKNLLTVDNFYNADIVSKEMRLEDMLEQAEEGHRQAMYVRSMHAGASHLPSRAQEAAAGLLRFGVGALNPS